MRTEEFDLSDFSRVEVGYAFEVEVVQSDSYSVGITADDDLLKHLNVSKEGETLKVGHSKHIGWRATITRPKARVTMPVLKGLRLSGACTGTIGGFSSSEDFELNLSGASRVTGEIAAGNADLTLSGASRADLTGSAEKIVIEASGASRMELAGFSAHDAAVKLSGASRSTVTLDGKLDAKLSGASKFSWIGNPVIGEIKTSGASTLDSKQSS